MQWYAAAPLLYHLENVVIAPDRNLTDVRFPVQWVIRPMSDDHHDYRGYAGQLAGGLLHPGSEIVVLPGGRASRIKSIDTFSGEVEAAFPPMSVALRLEDEIDISRGDMIYRPHNAPATAQDIEAMICWMSDERALTPRTKLVIKHTTRTARAMVRDLHYRLDVNTLHRHEDAERLELNEIGRVNLRVTQPLFADDYGRNRFTGGFILIDESTNATVAAGMIMDSR
jgi:bifunctional enzyme CysN/CysC